MWYHTLVQPFPGAAACVDDKDVTYAGDYQRSS